MTKTVAVLGAGAGGTAAAADLGARGWRVRLWHPSPVRLEAFAADSVASDGVLGARRVPVELVPTRLGDALDGAAAAVVCLPAVALGPVVDALAAVDSEVPVVLNPGHTGGALRLRRSLARPIAALSTLTYVARSPRPGAVTVTAVARRVRGAALPGGEAALTAAVELFPQVMPQPDVLAVDLSNTNLVLHPPGAICGAAWIEGTNGDFRFYADGMTPGVIRVLEALDVERRAVALAYGHRLPSLVEEMAAIGTVDQSTADTRAAIAGAAANAAIRAPESLNHRYYREDLAFGLVPFLAFAHAAGVDAPTARALLHIGEALLGEPLGADGLTAERLGIAGLDAAGVRDLVRP
jgi:opine dehydrogenase